MLQRRQEHEPLTIENPLIQKFLTIANQSPQTRCPHRKEDAIENHSNAMFAMHLEARKKHGIAFWQETINYFKRGKHSDPFAREALALIEALLLDLERLEHQVNRGDRLRIFAEYYFQNRHLSAINVLFSRFSGGENSKLFPTSQRYYLEDGGWKLCHTIAFIDIFTHDFYAGKISRPSIELANTALYSLQEYISGLARLQEMMSGTMPADLHELKIRILSDREPRAAIGFSNYVRDKMALRLFLNGKGAHEIVLSDEIFPLFFQQKNTSKIPPWFQEEHALWLSFSDSTQKALLAKAREDIDHFRKYDRRPETNQTR